MSLFLPYVMEMGLLAVAMLGGSILWFLFQTRPRRKREPGFEYIYVEDYGSARELDADEMIYLKTEFHGGDGSRPYIKHRYEEITPDGKMHGYLRRRQLPKKIKIKPVEARK